MVSDIYSFESVSLYFVKYTDHVCQICLLWYVLNSVNDSIIIGHTVLDYHPPHRDILQRR